MVSVDATTREGKRVRRQYGTFGAALEAALALKGLTKTLRLRNRKGA